METMVAEYPGGAGSTENLAISFRLLRDGCSRYRFTCDCVGTLRFCCRYFFGCPSAIFSGLLQGYLFLPTAASSSPFTQFLIFFGVLPGCRLFPFSSFDRGNDGACSQT